MHMILQSADGTTGTVCQQAKIRGWHVRLAWWSLGGSCEVSDFEAEPNPPEQSQQVMLLCSRLVSVSGLCLWWLVTQLWFCGCYQRRALPWRHLRLATWRLWRKCTFRPAALFEVELMRRQIFHIDEDIDD